MLSILETNFDEYYNGSDKPKTTGYVFSKMTKKSYPPEQDDGTTIKYKTIKNDNSETEKAQKEYEERTGSEKLTQQQLKNADSRWENDM